MQVDRSSAHFPAGGPPLLPSHPKPEETLVWRAAPADQRAQGTCQVSDTAGDAKLSSFLLLETGQAIPQLDLDPLSPEAQKNIAGDVFQTLRDEGAQRILAKGAPVASHALRTAASNVSSSLGTRILAHGARTVGAAVPLVGSVISVKEAADDHQRAHQEASSGHHLAARAFQASARLNEVDAAAGVVSAGAAASVVGAGVAAGAEVTGWVVSGVGMVVAIGGEILSDKGL